MVITNNQRQVNLIKKTAQRKRLNLGKYLFYSPISNQIKHLKSSKQNFNSLPDAKSNKLNADNLRCKATKNTKDETKIHRVEAELSGD